MAAAPGQMTCLSISVRFIVWLAVEKARSFRREAIRLWHEPVSEVSVVSLAGSFPDRELRDAAFSLGAAPGNC